MIRTTWPILVSVIVLALLGAYLSYGLMLKHEVNTTGVSWLEAVCETPQEAVSTRSCQEVVHSKWGTFPPIQEGTEEAYRNNPVPFLGYFAMRPRPVSLYGMMYFSILAAWYVGVGRPDYSRRRWHLLPLSINLIGVLGALFFTYLMFAGDLKAWCPLCLAAHVINGLLFIGGVLLWPCKPTSVPETTPPIDAGETPPQLDAAPATSPIEHGRRAVRYPSGRLVFVTIGAMLAVTAAEWYFHEFAGQSRRLLVTESKLTQMSMNMDRLLSHGDLLYSMYEVNEKKDIPIRADDPVLHPGPDRLSMVVFSDFRCPFCIKFARYTQKFLLPMFDGHLKIVFKHYPADTECNAYLKSDLHPGACEAAAAAEAARVLGGSSAFWKAHDLLFAAHDQTDKDTYYPRLAEALGFDPQRFTELMHSPQVQQRIKEDIEVGRSIGLTGTPSVYLSERHVPSICRQQEAFWTEVKKRYDVLLRARLEQRARQGRGATEEKSPE